MKAADEQDSKNIVIRALAFNRETVPSIAKNASEIDKRGVPRGSVYGPSQAAVGAFAHVTFSPARFVKCNLKIQMEN